MKNIFGVLQKHLGEEDEIDFTDFFKNMNEVALSCNIEKIQE